MALVELFLLAFAPPHSHTNKHRANMLSICDSSQYRARYVKTTLAELVNPINHVSWRRRMWFETSGHPRASKQPGRRRALSLTHAGTDNVSYFAGKTRVGNDVALMARRSTILRYHLDAVLFNDKEECIECGKPPMPFIWVFPRAVREPQNLLLTCNIINDRAPRWFCTCRESACRFAHVSGLGSANYFVRSSFAREFARTFIGNS